MAEDFLDTGFVRIRIAQRPDPPQVPDLFKSPFYWHGYISPVRKGDLTCVLPDLASPRMGIVNSPLGRDQNASTVELISGSGSPSPGLLH